MRGVGKITKKLFLLAVAMVLVLSTSIVAFAAGGTKMTKLQLGSSASGKFKTVSKTELYVNGESAAVAPEEVGATGAKATARPESIELDVNAQIGSAQGGEYLVTSSNRMIASVKRVSNNVNDAGYYKLVITAGQKNGKAVITVRDRYNFKKMAKVTVTVKSLAEEVNTGINVSGDTMVVAKGGKLSLGASVDSTASNQKLKYTILEGKDYIKVDGKGNVTGKKFGKAVVRISAQDQQYVVGKKKTTYGAYTDVEVLVRDSVVNSAVITNPQKNSKGKYETIHLKSNELSDIHSYQLVAEAYDASGDLLSDDSVTYTSSKASVATVDENGIITAVGKGTAKISVIPADGGKLKKAATVTVKVTTDVEQIKVPDNNIVVLLGKSQKIGATVDKTVSNKKLTYTVLDGSGVVSVSSSGVIKGLTEGNAVIKVAAADKGGAERKVHVTVIDPVAKLSAVVPDYKKGALVDSNNTTLYLKEDIGADEVAFDTCTIKTTISSKLGKSYTLDDEKVTFSSNNTKVATVDENGVIEAKKAGKATITVSATDGSKKKATVKVTVKSKVQNITIGDEKYNEVYVVNGKAATIKAVTDSMASNKKVSLSFKAEDAYASNVTLKGTKLTAKGVDVADDAEVKVGVLTVTAKDATDAPKQNAYSEEFDVYVIATDRYVAQDMLALDKTGVSLKRGDKSSAVKEMLDIPADVTERTLTWKSSNTKAVAVDKNGVLTAKKTGEATITVSAKKGSGASATINVRVGESQADFEKSVDEKVNLVVTSEDYTWVGMKPSFDSKKSVVTIDIVDATKDRDDAYSVKEEIKNVLGIFVDAMAEVSYREVEFYDTNDDIDWIVRREGTNLKIYKDGKEIASNGVLNVNATVVALANAMCENADTLASWNGKTFETVLVKEDSKVGYEDIYYNAEYTVQFSAEDIAVDSLIDARTEKAIAAFKNDKNVTGINSITYKAENNTTVIDIADGGKKVADVAVAVKADTIKSFKSIFAEASKVSLEVQGVTVDKDEMTFVRNKNTDVDAAIEKMYDKLLDKLDANGIKNLSALNGVTVRADVTFKFGNESYDVEYYVTFVRSMNAVDDAVDAAVVAEVAEMNAQNAGLGWMTYNTDSNTLTVNVKNGGKDISELAGIGVVGFAQTVLTKQDAVAAKIVVEGKATEFGKIEDITSANLLKAMGGDMKTLSDLVGKKVVVEVYYNIDKTESLLYVVEFFEATGTQDGEDVPGTQDGNDSTQDGNDKADANVSMVNDGEDVTF